MTKSIKSNYLILFLSILIPLVVAILFPIKIPNSTPLKFLPPIYATINGITSVLLVIALIAIKKGNMNLHKRIMQVCILLSIAFLVMYVSYHLTSLPTRYGGQGILRWVYLFILISHILFSIAVIPLVMISYVKALSKQFDKHKKISKITFPIWLYVAITGVLVYIMISPYYE